MERSKKMKKKCILSSIVFLMFAMAGTASAALFDDIDLKYSAGMGANQAILVIDFNENSAMDSFAFGFSWDGMATGEDMLLAVDAAGGLDVTSGGTGAAFFVQDISFDGNERGASSTGEFWALYTAQGSDPNFPADWAEAAVGAGALELSNLSWHGWSIPFGPAPDFAAPPPPDVPLSASVPEPGTLLLLVSCLMGLIGIRRSVTK
jgi:hypothetical protein